MQEYEAGDDETLSGFDTVDASVYIDGVRAENCQHSHVNVVEDAQVDHAPHEWL
jgi:outer membrane receptor for monomeric catechols